MTLTERREKEEELVDILVKLQEDREQAIESVKQYSDRELISAITDFGMLVDWD